MSDEDPCWVPRVGPAMQAQDDAPAISVRLLVWQVCNTTRVVNGSRKDPVPLPSLLKCLRSCKYFGVFSYHIRVRAEKWSAPNGIYVIPGCVCACVLGEAGDGEGAWLTNRLFFFLLSFFFFFLPPLAVRISGHEADRCDRRDELYIFDLRNRV